MHFLPPLHPRHEGDLPQLRGRVDEAPEKTPQASELIGQYKGHAQTRDATATPRLLICAIQLISEDFVPNRL